jgi:hypothetical protein
MDFSDSIFESTHPSHDSTVVEIPFNDCRYAFGIDLSISAVAGGGEWDARHSQEIAW